MPNLDLEKVITKTSNLYQIDPNWVKAIIKVESNGNPYAVRYEGNYQYLYQPEKFAKSVGVSLSTEIATQKISWGLGQTMGALAREQGHTGMLAELVKPDVSLKHVCIRLDTLKKRCSIFADIAACYNGGPDAFHKQSGIYMNQTYVDKVLAALDKLN